MVSFEIFVKAMPPSLSELKVLPSFCFAFKIPDDVAASTIGRHCSLTFDLYKMTQVIMEGLKFFFQGKSIAATTSKTFPCR